MTRKYLSLIIPFFVIISCGSTKNSLVIDTDASTVSVLAGVSAGGLVENTSMSGISGSSDIDAITGATNKSYNAGIHYEMNINGHRLETGLDYIGFDQAVEYDMPSFSVNGKRTFRFYQLRVPVTYNLGFFRNSRNFPRFVLKAGFSVGYTFSKSITDYGSLPDYKFTGWDYGPTLGVSFYPIQLSRGYRIGVYLDLYRGSQIYEDAYHRAEGIGGQSFVKFGLVLQPLNLKL
ncbi:MAG: hypothetical protein GXO77_02650 [Calditrichaeota bacterium]|nr:hypothetical protein [Calditrichota bacterium]